MIPSMVTHHPKLLKSDKTLQLQLNKEFDTSAAQLVHFKILSCYQNEDVYTKTDQKIFLFGQMAENFVQSTFLFWLASIFFKSHISLNFGNFYLSFCI